MQETEIGAHTVKKAETLLGFEFYGCQPLKTAV